MTQPRLKVGLIGYGYAGKTFHAPLISAVPELELAAVASSDAARVHADWPGVTVHAAPAELIVRDDLDLVVIATPNDTHHPLARAALLAGRNVVVDKPFTVALDDDGDLCLCHLACRVMALELCETLTDEAATLARGEIIDEDQMVLDGARSRARVLRESDTSLQEALDKSRFS